MQRANLEIFLSIIFGPRYLWKYGSREIRQIKKLGLRANFHSQLHRIHQNNEYLHYDLFTTRHLTDGSGSLSQEGFKTPRLKELYSLRRKGEKALIYSLKLYYHPCFWSLRKRHIFLVILLFYLNLQAVLAELFIYFPDHAVSYKVQIQMGRGKEKEAS